MATAFRVLMAIIMGVIVGWVFLKGTDDQTILQDHTGGLFMLLMGQAFPVGSAALAACM